MITLRKKIIITTALAITLIGCSNAAKDNKASTQSEDIEFWHASETDKVSLDEKQNNNIDSENNFAAIDWKYYENLMATEDQEDFEDYLPALTNEAKFYCFDWCDSEVTFDEYLSSILADEQVDIEGLVLVDLDNQNGKELVISFSEGGGNFLILTRDSGKIYATSLGTRFFEELQKDGKYYGSGGAGDLYFCTLKIDKDGVNVTTFGELHGEEKEDGSYGDRLVVDGKLLDQEPQDWLAENYNDPVDWIK